MYVPHWKNPRVLPMMTLGGTNFNASKERTVVSSAIQEVPKMQDSMQLEGILFLESILLPTSHSL
jgi:hypothetical protein